MIKVIVTKNGSVSNSSIFNSQEEANAWIAKCESEEVWGAPEIRETVLNENGEENINITPAEYEVLIEDCTAEVEQERINKEAKEYLIKTDYVVLKFAEALAKGESIEGLTIKYESVLLNRAAVREQIV